MLRRLGDHNFDEGDDDHNRALRHALARAGFDDSDGIVAPGIEDRVDDELSAEYELALEEPDATARAEALAQYAKRRSKRVEELTWKHRQTEGQEADWRKQQEIDWKRDCERRTEYDDLKKHLSTICKEDLMAEAHEDSQAETGAKSDTANSETPLGAEEKFLRQNRDRFQDAFQLYNEAFLKVLVKTCSFPGEDTLLRCSEKALQYAEKATQNYMQALMKATPLELGVVEIIQRERLFQFDSGES